MTENGTFYSPLKNINRVDEIKKEAKDITGGAYLLAVARIQAVEQNNQVQRTETQTFNRFHWQCSGSGIRCLFDPFNRFH
jgi:hypothetical protein